MKERWRSVGKHRAFADWVRALRGKNGVYLIREIPGFLNLGSSEIAYIGESHNGRLYETLTRHFQNWDGPTAGPTFARDAVEVRVIVTAPDQAVSTQDRLICKIRPSRNRSNPCDDEDVPF